MYKKLGSHYCANCWSLTVLRVSPPGTKDALISCFLFFLFIDLTTHTHHNNQLKIKNSFKKSKRGISLSKGDDLKQDSSRSGK